MQRGRRAVSDPTAVAWETPARDLEDEYERKVRMSARCWQHVVSGKMLQGGGPLFLLQIASHRLLRYESGLLHLLLLVLAAVLTVASGAHVLYGVMLALQLAWLALALAGRLRLPVPAAGIAYYYFLVTWATLAGAVALHAPRGAGELGARGGHAGPLTPSWAGWRPGGMEDRAGWRPGGILVQRTTAPPGSFRLLLGAVLPGARVRSRPQRELLDPGPGRSGSAGVR